MAGRITLTMIKPGAVKNEHIGHILTMISEAGFRISAMKFAQLRRSQAEAFYKVHKDKTFFNALIEYMISGPLVAAILEKDNAVKDYRELIGATDPTKADNGTIRKLFAESVQKNAVHGSDSDTNAQIEANFFFSTSERFTEDGYILL